VGPDYSTVCEAVARRLWGDPSQASDKELRWGTRGARKLTRRTGQWYDHERGQGGSTIELIRRELGYDFKQSLAWLRSEGFEAPSHSRMNGKSPKGKVPRLGKVVETYLYTDEDGKLLSKVLRYEPKDFRQCKADGSWGVECVRRVLYRLPE